MVIELQHGVLVVVQVDAADGTILADGAASHIKTTELGFEEVGQRIDGGVERQKLVSQFLAQGDADDGLRQGVGAYDMRLGPRVGAELVSIGMVYRMSSHNAMVIIVLMRREGVGQLVDMGGLQCHGVAIATRQAELQHKRVEHGVGAKRLACHREAELRVEARFRSAKDGVFRRAQQGVGRVGRVD